MHTSLHSGTAATATAPTLTPLFGVIVVVDRDQHEKLMLCN